MKYLVALAMPALIEGAVRYPVEGPFTVSEAEAMRLYEAKVLDADPEAIDPGAGFDEEEGDGLDKMLVADLDRIIAAEGIEVPEPGRKAEKVAAIRAKREAIQE